MSQVKGFSTKMISFIAESLLLNMKEVIAEISATNASEFEAKLSEFEEKFNLSSEHKDSISLLWSEGSEPEKVSLERKLSDLATQKACEIFLEVFQARRTYVESGDATLSGTETSLKKFLQVRGIHAEASDLIVSEICTTVPFYLEKQSVSQPIVTVN